MLVVQRSCPLSCQQTLKQLAVGDMAAQNRSYSFHIVSHRFRIQHAYACLACPETGQARCETFLVSSTLACWLSVNSKVTTSPGSWPWKDYGRYGRTRDIHRFGQAVDICRLRYDSLASVFGHSFVQKLQDLKCRSQGANGANKKTDMGHGRLTCRTFADFAGTSWWAVELWGASALDLHISQIFTMI